MPQFHRFAPAALLLVLAGCSWPGYRPAGSQASNDAHTYISTPDAAKSVRVLDSSTNTVLWSMDVPIGKQLTLQFYDDHDPRNADRPALMRWELSNAGREFGELHSSMPVPDQHHRRIDWYLTRNPGVPVPEAAAVTPPPPTR
jgi:hypothetical protein